MSSPRARARLRHVSYGQIITDPLHYCYFGHIGRRRERAAMPKAARRYRCGGAARLLSRGATVPFFRLDESEEVSVYRRGALGAYS
jgi:hypothetical protein